MGFSAVRVRWLPLWAIVGSIVVQVGTTALGDLAGVPLSDDLVTALSYLPIVAWVGLVVVRRNGVDLAVLFRWPRLGGYWFVVAGMFVVQFLFTIGVVTLLQLLIPDLGAGLEGTGTATLLVSVVALVVLPPLVEETVFRGILVERWSMKWQVVTAVLVSSLCFGVLHVDPVGAGVFGIVLALMYLRTASLWPGVLLHAANNGLVLLVVRLQGSATTEVADPTVAESLGTAAVALGLSVPALAWFMWTHWPRRGTITPYQAHEAQWGRFPDRVLRDVEWSGWPGPVRLDVGSDRLAVSPPGRRAQPFAVVALGRVRASYVAPGPLGSQVVVLLDDGSWTTLRLPGARDRAVEELATTVAARAAVARGAAAIPGRPWPSPPAGTARSPRR